MSLSFPNFSFSVSVSTNIFQRGELEYDVLVTGWNKKFVEKVLLSINLKESPSPEVKTKMVLHSEVQAEESHQEQRDYTERLESHGIST